MKATVLSSACERFEPRGGDMHLHTPVCERMDKTWIQDLISILPSGFLSISFMRCKFGVANISRLDNPHMNVIYWIL